MDQNRNTLPAWHALEEHVKALTDTKIKALFEQDKKRFDKFSLSVGPLMLDYSKQLMTADTVQNLTNFAEACDLAKWRLKLFEGEELNKTEKRAVLHTALRDQDRREIKIDSANIEPLITATKDKMRRFSESVRDEGKYKHIVNIGIGGSDLSVRMAAKALKDYIHPDITLHFVSNMDYSDLKETLDQIDAAHTLFIVTSKTFSTLETITNAKTAKAWLEEKLGKGSIDAHFAAVTKNTEAAEKFGISKNMIFPMWDWVGGRFSIWSAVGLALCIGFGWDNFEKMLQGAYDMDNHFVQAPFNENMPVLLALIGIWQRNFLKYECLSIAPYSEDLSLFPDYLQQLDMESNGKSVTRDGAKIDYETGPVIFGSKGSNAQHAYFQLFHQGTTDVPCDFILIKADHQKNDDHHIQLLSNAVAQSKAFMEGKEDDDLINDFGGDRPSNTLILDELSPYTLGMLMALYEHKIFVQGIVWNVNSFDQFGVELGKTLSRDIVKKIEDKDFSGLDSSSAGLLRYLFET